MRLDDRPVIDQLTEPDPIQVAYAAHERAVERVLDLGLGDQDQNAVLVILDDFVDELEVALP